MRRILVLVALTFAGISQASIEFNPDLAVTGLQFFGATYDEIQGDLTLIDR